MKLFQLTIPNEQHGKIVSTLQDELKLDNVTSVEARTSSIVTFRVEDDEMQAILNKLQRMGVGVQFGFCDVMSLTPGTTMRKRSRTKKKKRTVGRILERNTDVGTAVPVAEMYAHIEANSTLSRDSVGMLLISSPYAVALDWPTAEMRSRGQAIQLLFGAVIAALSGTGVALAESNANISSVVGTAIAAALLPPTVNCGLCFSYVMIGQYFTDDVIGEEQKLVFYEIAVGSLMLVWINVILIYVTAVLVFKIKKVGQFQLVRRVDEGAWQNLPRVQRSPVSSNIARRERLESNGSVNSSHEFLDREEDADYDAAPKKETGMLPKLAPVRRRPQPLASMEEMDPRIGKADAV
ncbi:hypothetical protein BBJ28_00013396 [Nothophytophthora sp. Chile5]|nr:hypothetical protein BBJ28_00013396 [Nothophytophthora sp. Chile5]